MSAVPPEERVLDLGESATAFGETGFAAFDTAAPLAADAVEPAVVEAVPVAETQPMPMNFDPAADTASLEHQVTPTGPIVEPAAPASAPAVGNITFSPNELSPETIGAIARRVVELMSDNAVREIAWEVVPQLGDPGISNGSWTNRSKTF